VRLYRPEPELLDGRWTFPVPRPASVTGKEALSALVEGKGNDDDGTSADATGCG